MFERGKFEVNDFLCQFTPDTYLNMTAYFFFIVDDNYLYHGIKNRQILWQQLDIQILKN